MPKIDHIAAQLADYQPELSDIAFEDALVRGAVAAVLREREGAAQVLFIRRAEHESDPWSGHIAFPGGRVDSADEPPRSAAERETLEEVGLSLEGARYLGRLDDVTGTTETVVVSAFVYHVGDHDELVLNYEVDEVYWFPLAELARPQRRIVKRFEYRGREVELPAVRVFDDEDAPVLWGLTYRLVEILMQIAGRPIPSMPWV